jgi:hypothetical protein
MGLVYTFGSAPNPSVTSYHHYSCSMPASALRYILLGSVGSQVRPRSGTDVAEPPTDRFGCDAKGPIR